MKALPKLLLTGLLPIFTCIASFSQFDIGRRIEEEARSRADQRIDEGIDRAFDAAEEGIINAVENEEEASEENEASTGNDDSDDRSSGSKNPNATAGQSTSPAGATAQARQTSEVTLSTYSRFDFIPGEKVFFFEDFSQDELADFPALWNTDGSGAVTTTNLYPGKWFRMEPRASYMPEMSIPLSKNFTFEFDLIFIAGEETGINEFYVNLFKQEPGYRIGEYLDNHVEIYMLQAYSSAYSYVDQDLYGEGTQDFDIEAYKNKVAHVSLWVQNQRLRLYIDQTKVLDLPRLVPADAAYDRIQFRLGGNDQDVLISNLRGAYGLPDNRSKLLTEGKLVTYGITFDTNSDKVKPTSFSTLKEIATIMNENAGLRIKIVGHTDSDGDAASNLDLSKRRAASVRNVLSSEFGISASRMETDGKGETEPISSNNTAEGKASNRRVELIKL